MPKRSKQYWRERRRAHRLARRIIRFLEDDPKYVIKLERLDAKRRAKLGLGAHMQVFGCIDEETRTIHIDFRFDVVMTIAHEVLHILYEGIPEREIKKKEKLLKKHLTNAQANKIWLGATYWMQGLWVKP